MEFGQWIRGGCLVLTLTGPLDLAAVPEVRRALFKLLSEQPPAVVCDLSGVMELDPLCAGVFTAVRHPALGWAGTSLVLCAARPAVAATLRALGVPRWLPLYGSLDQALADTGSGLTGPRQQLWLAASPTASRTARAFVRRVCRDWDLDELGELAELLAGELTINAMADIPAAFELQLELRGGHLYIAMHDQDPRMLRVLAPGDEDGEALSMLIIRELSSAWGVRRHPAG